MYKMYLISGEGYKNTKVDFLAIKTTSEIREVWKMLEVVTKNKLTIDVTCLKNTSCKQRIKTWWILFVWSVKRILKILTKNG